MRLVTFLVAAVVWYPLRAHNVVAVLASAGALAAFIGCVAAHGRARRQRVSADRELAVVNEARQRVGGMVVAIRSTVRPPDATEIDACLPIILDPGPTWSITEQERDDLDLFSRPVGIFGLLNRTSTVVGARRLRDAIDRPRLSPGHITRRQAAVRWLSERPAERMRLLAALACFRTTGDRLDAFIRAVHDAEPLPASIRGVLLRAWSVVTGAASATLMTLSLYGHGRAFLGFIGLFLLNGFIYGWWRSRVNAFLTPFKTLTAVAEALAETARSAPGALPAETELAELRERFRSPHERGILRRLKSRLQWSDSGGAMHEMFNVLVFYDVHVACAIANAVLPHRNALLECVSAVADLEVVCSQACFAWEQPATCMPTVDGEARIEIQRGTHPLIAPGRVIANDVRLDQTMRTWVITGPNMAGKSTLLRMVGVNTLLAQMGSAVTAHAMRWTPLRLITDLQARDNLSEDESYFLAEVRHVRRLVKPTPGDEPMLGLIDEPFRGTNSDEQVAAAVAVLRHLIASGHNFIVATHTSELTTLPDDRTAANFHFNEQLDATGMVFDYALRPGPAVTRNALLVLEREGYPREVLDDARAWLKQSAAHDPDSGSRGNAEA